MSSIDAAAADLIGVVKWIRNKHHGRGILLERCDDAQSRERGGGCRALVLLQQLESSWCYENETSKTKWVAWLNE